MGQENFKRLYEWAEKVKQDFAIDYNLEGVKKLEEVIIASREIFHSWPESEQYFRVHCFGAFLGQCMILNFNGEWHMNADSVGIKLSDQGVWASPFQKVWKQYQEDGQHDSITSFYEISGNFDAIVNVASEKGA